ncbi:MAG: AsmA family protein [Pseudomonadales bacterium]
MQKLAKLTLWVLGFMILIVVAVLAFAIIKPQASLKLLEHGTGYKVESDELVVDTSASALSSKGLTVTDPQGKKLFSAENFLASVDALGAWNGVSPFWDIRIANAHLYLSSAENSEADAKAPSQVAASALDFGRILGAKSVNIDSLTVHTGETETLYSVMLERMDEQQFSLVMRVGDRLAVDGELEYKLAGRTSLHLTIPELDLRPMMSADTTVVQEQAESNNSGDGEAVLDWAWLGMLRNADVQLTLGRLLLPDHAIEGADAKLGFGVDSVNVDLDLDAIKLDHAKTSSVPKLKLQTQLKALGLQTTGADLAGELTLSAINLKTKVGGNFNVNGVTGNKFSVDANLGHQSSIDGLLPENIKPYLPAQLSAKLAIDELSYSLSALQATLAKSDIAGELKLSLVDGSPDIYARLHSNNLLVGQSDSTTSADSEEISEPIDDTLQEGQAEKSTEEGMEQVQPAKKDKLFSKNPIDFAWLDEGKYDVEITANTLQLYQAGFSDFKMKLTGEQGKLQLEPFGASLGGGGFTGSASVNRAETGMQAKLAFGLKGVDLEAFGVVPQEQLSGGKTELQLNIATLGGSTAELASSLNGKVHLLVRDAVLQNDSFELIGSDLLLETLNKLNPFAKSDPTTKLHCALVHFDIENGLMKTDKGLVVETEKMEIIGDGNINLEDETLDILITPNAKQTVGLNVGSVVKFMKLGGTLASPSPAVDAGGLLKSGASIGAALSTGGVSLLAENLVNKVAKENACRAALAVEE